MAFLALELGEASSLLVHSRRIYLLVTRMQAHTQRAIMAIRKLKIAPGNLALTL